MRELIFNNKLSDGAKVFYQMLWLAYGNQCEASNRELKELSKISEDTILKRLKELSAAGFIKTYYNQTNNRVIHLCTADLQIPSVKSRIPSADLRNPININELVLDSESISSEDSESVVESKNESESCKKENKEKKPTKKENKEAHAKELLASLALPSSLDPDLWNTFIAHRAEIKKPLKAVGKSRMIHRLLDLEAQGIDINEAIETSIRNGWQDVFAPKPSSKPKAKDEFSRLEPMELTEKILKELQAQYPDFHRVFAIDCKKEFYAFGRRVESYSRENSRLLRFARS